MIAKIQKTKSSIMIILISYVASIHNVNPVFSKGSIIILDALQLLGIFFLIDDKKVVHFSDFSKFFEESIEKSQLTFLTKKSWWRIE